MALPFTRPFKTRYVTATTSSSNSIASAPILSRGKIQDGYYATTPLASHTAVGTITVQLNGTSVNGQNAITVTTSTGDSATAIPLPTTATYVKPGDVLSVTGSSVVGGTLTIAIQEF